MTVYEKTVSTVTATTASILDEMDNTSCTTESLDSGDTDIMETSNFYDAKPAVISAIIVMNVIMNSLVITVIARYPELREDSTTLFMLSLSVSDLAAGCTFMPISAALCSRAIPDVADMHEGLPNLHAFMMWWLGFNSMHSLCWLNISKTIAILKPLRCEHLLTHRCCYIIIAINWIVGCVLASVNFKLTLGWNTEMCSFRFSRDRQVAVFYMLYSVVGGALPVSITVYGTTRICIVVVRAHRQIAALERSVTGESIPIGNISFVTMQALRSSKNVIIICAVSLALNTPALAFSVLRIVSGTPGSGLFSFVSMWMFETNTFVNSLLYLLLYRSVREKTLHMIRALLDSIRSQ